MKATVSNPQHLPAALEKARQEAKAQLMAGKRVVVSVSEETRRDTQNRKFHALCGDLARSGLQWMGKPRDAKQWKVLLVSGHAVATKEEAEIIPGLESEFVNVRESTALMSVRRGASLIEYTLAFCAMHKVPTLEDES
jgi:NinB protein